MLAMLAESSFKWCISSSLMISITAQVGRSKISGLCLVRRGSIKAWNASKLAHSQLLHHTSHTLLSPPRIAIVPSTRYSHRYPHLKVMPRPASLRDLIRQHPRERLLVQPLEWTARHLELLRCSFEEEEGKNKENEEENGKEVETPEAKESGKNKPASRFARTAERLATSEMKTAAMKKLLAEVDGPLKFLRPFGYFCYGFEHEFRLHGAVFAERAVGTQAPIFAFMQRGMIRIQREGVFSLPRPRRPNPPAELIRKMRLKQLEPSDPWCDPYILAVLVGLAQSQSQSQCLEKDSGSKGRPGAFKVCAVLVDETNTEMMGFYTATISTEFLSKFEYPDGLKPTKETLASSLCIKHRKMAFQPYSTLKERLIEAMTPCFDNAEASKV